MKSLLRKKTPTDNRQTPPPSSIQSTRQPSTIETPLYARFASIKPGLPPQDRPRPAVSGPMPLGRPNRANLDADENRKRHEQAVLLRHRSSSSRQEVPLGSQLLPGSLPRDVQSPLDAVHQDARVILTQAARLPIKAQTFSFSDERLASSKPRRTMATEKVQHSRDFLPSPPISPRSSHYPQQLMSASVYQPPSSSFPSGVKPHATVMGVSTIPIHVYGEPRLTTTLSADNPPPTSAPIYNATQPEPPEKPLKVNDNFSATGPPRSPNQTLDDIEPLSTSVSPHHSAALAPQVNGSRNSTILGKSLSGHPPNGHVPKGKLDHRTSLAEDFLPLSNAASQTQASAYRNGSQVVVAETTSSPFATPPQSPNRHAGTVAPARRADTQARGRPLIFDPDPQLEQVRPGPRIFTARDNESHPIFHGRGTPPEVGQRVQQLPQTLVQPLRTGTVNSSSEHDEQLALHRSSARSQPYWEEKSRTSRATAPYEDEAPPVAHPAMRALSKGSIIRVHGAQSFQQEERKPPLVEHSRKSDYGKRLLAKPPPPRGPSPLPVLAPASVVMQSSSQAELDAYPSARLSSRSLPERNTSSPESSIPPTPPEKSPSYLFRSEWLGHTQPRSSQPLAPANDVEMYTRYDVHKSWAIPVSVGAGSEEDLAIRPNVENSQVNVPETFMLDGLTMHEISSRPVSSIDGNRMRAPAGAGQLHGDFPDVAVAPSDPHVDGSIESESIDGPPHPQNTIQQPSEGDNTLEISNSSVDLEPMVRPRPRVLPVPPSPEEYSRARARRRGTWLEKAVPADIAELAEETKPKFYPLLEHLQNPELLAQLLVHLSFYEWLILWGGVSKVIRQVLDSDTAICDVALERYLGTVGYVRWLWPSPEPIRITLAEMHAYMRGVSAPVHVYAQSAFTALFSSPTEESALLIRGMKKETRAFNRVVIRLRTQAEADAEHGAAIRRGQNAAQPQSQRQHNGPPPSWSAVAVQGQSSKYRSASRQSSRAPSPTNSAWSHGPGSQAHLPLASVPTPGGFRSPLFRLRRAPLLRVFVPSPEGDWLSDAGVLECEMELRKAGILPLLRVGDVVWDTALGDEGNVGRLVWDGRYLIDLDYTFSQIGDVSPLLPALAFPPSYFHRVIRVAGDRNPIAHLDIRFWGEEIIANLQLLQDRVRTETPQGAYHTVVRWVHRSSFTIRPPPGGTPMIMLPNRERRVVDSGWRGTVVVEAEGTNEGLADLRARCRGVFQPRAGDVAPPPGERERMVWRVLRERSRPGEIWIRAVSFKERLIP